MIQIEKAKPIDAREISELINGVSHYFTLDPDGKGADAFLKSIDPDAINTYITSPDYQYFVGRLKNDLVGVVAVRNKTHLFHLFVAPKYQRQGYSRKLWDYAKLKAIDSGAQGGFTVNSTPFAIETYQRFGFEVAGERVETHGIAFIPMRLNSVTENS